VRKLKKSLCSAVISLTGQHPAAMESVSVSPICLRMGALRGSTQTVEPCRNTHHGKGCYSALRNTKVRLADQLGQVVRGAPAISSNSTWRVMDRVTHLRFLGRRKSGASAFRRRILCCVGAFGRHVEFVLGSYSARQPLRLKGADFGYSGRSTIRIPNGKSSDGNPCADISPAARVEGSSFTNLPPRQA
jgi:hypothetical protein